MSGTHCREWKRTPDPSSGDEEKPEDVLGIDGPLPCVHSKIRRNFRIANQHVAEI